MCTQECQSFCNSRRRGAGVCMCSWGFIGAFIVKRPETRVSVCTYVTVQVVVMSQHQCHRDKFLCIGLFSELISSSTDTSI